MMFFFSWEKGEGDVVDTESFRVMTVRMKSIKAWITWNSQIFRDFLNFHIYLNFHPFTKNEIFNDFREKNVRLRLLRHQQSCREIVSPQKKITNAIVKTNFMEFSLAQKQPSSSIIYWNIFALKNENRKNWWWNFDWTKMIYE